MSVQLARYREGRDSGLSREDAAFEAGISLEEARLTDIADERGESAPAAEVQQGGTTMANRAQSKAEEVEEIKQPDFERAAKILRNDVKPAEEANAKSRGDLSAAWKVIQDECHVNKKAAKLIHWMRGASDELKDDFLRSLYGLMKELNLGISADLVDQMGDGEAPEMPVAKRAPVELVTVQ